MFGSVLDAERTFDRMTSVTRTRVRRRRLVLALTAALVAGAWAGPIARAVGDPAPAPVGRTTYLVRAGDTLWSIAKDVAPSGDPRALVDAISAANGVDAGGLVPGRVLVIPADS
jgi:Tfp pilus assembly protein FimV